MRAQQCRSWTNENAGYLSPEGAEVGPAQWRPGAQTGSDPGQEEETDLT